LDVDSAVLNAGTFWKAFLKIVQDQVEVQV
jgi:hypothetical protein